jgi:hypothetical protein
MRQLLIVIVIFVAGLAETHPLRAAQYEVIPTTYDHNILNHAYNYQATIFDNVGGRVFVCTATYIELAGKTLSYSCVDRSREMGSTLPPSGDLNTIIQSPNWQGSLPVAGLWQINSKSGDLQFCLAWLGDSTLFRPAQNCIKLGWKDPKSG